MLPKEMIPVEQLLESYETALAQTGYSITTKLLLVRRAELMIRRHLNAGLVYFDQAVINRYMGEIDDKYFKGNMRQKHYERTNTNLKLKTLILKRHRIQCHQWISGFTAVQK